MTRGPWLETSTLHYFQQQQWHLGAAGAGPRATGRGGLGDPARRGPCHTGSPSSRNPSRMMSRKQAFPLLWRKVLCLPRLFVHQTSLQRQPGTKAGSALLTQRTEARQAHGNCVPQSIRPEWSPNRMRLYLTNNFDFCQNEDRLKLSISIFILLTIFYILTGHLLILGLLFNIIYPFCRSGHLYLLTTL